MATNPPFFGSIGKGFKDLWKKKFDFKNVVKHVSKTSEGVTITTTGTLEPDHIVGNAVVKYTDKSWGEVESEIDSGSGKLYGKSTFSKLADGTKVVLGGGFDPSSSDKLVKESWSFKGEVEHTREAVSGGLSLTVGEEKREKETAVASNVTAHATIGYEGLSVGGQFQFKIDQTQSLQDYNIGIQWEKPTFVGALLTEKQGEVVKASYLHKASKDYTVGGEVVLDDTKKVLNFAAEFNQSPSVTYKFRGSNTGDVAAALEQRLSNPQVSLLYSASFKVKGYGNPKVDKFGLGITLGE